jgi:hypothetical protein
MKPRLTNGISGLNLAFGQPLVNPVSLHFGERPLQMKRTPSPPISPEMAAHIKFLVSVQKLYQHQVAALVGVNQGRISEIVNGHRHPGVGPQQGSFPF